MTTAVPDQAGVQKRVIELGPWFHDLEIHGVRTAPDHPLGPFLRELWTQVEPAFPRDMSGLSVLDIGCNAGFYSLKLHERGARATGIEHDPRYLEQARFAARAAGADIDYRLLSVYDVEQLESEFDYVLFMGVFYHLRHPLLALDRVAKIVRRRLVFQSLLRGSREAHATGGDYAIDDREVFRDPSFPAMHFIEHRYAGDPTNWWVPNARAWRRCFAQPGSPSKSTTGTRSSSAPRGEAEGAA